MSGLPDLPSSRFASTLLIEPADLSLRPLCILALTCIVLRTLSPIPISHLLAARDVTWLCEYLDMGVRPVS